MKIMIPGGSGQVGTVLARSFHKDGHEVVILSRTPQPAPWRIVQWDPLHEKDWQGEFDEADVVINLAGRSVNCRYNAANRSGRQYVSWIHETDFIRAVRFLIERHDLDGSINLASPNPLPNREFMAALRQAWGIPFGLPAAEWMLEIGAIFLRTETELILKSRRVIPGRLLQAGFTFTYPHWDQAARDLCQRWRELRR